MDATPGEPSKRVTKLAVAAAQAAAAPAPPPLFTPVVSPRAADRVSLAAGAILGVAAVSVARTAADAVRTVATVVRRSDDD